MGGRSSIPVKLIEPQYEALVLPVKVKEEA